MGFRPGTVSKILWHFTGGPQWDAKTQKQLKKLKPATAGYSALNSILSSKKLLTGNYREVVKVIVDKKRLFNSEQKQFETHNNYPVLVSSSPVCCVADIPLQHIAYHANRYGKIAIGFHREAIVREGFNPVMYTLENTSLLKSIYKGYSAVEDTDPGYAKNELDNFQVEVVELLEKNDLDEDIDSSSVAYELDSIEWAKDTINDSYENFLAYIKTFDEQEFDSIYCEREWRSINNFNFTIDDIAIIVLPKHQEGFDFYNDFLANTDLPRKITVAAWEDLIEH